MARGEGRKTRQAGTFGTVQQLPSGRYRAMYYGPDGRRYKAPTTFLAKADARGWLSLRQAEIINKAWTPPEATPKITRTTFADYARNWLKQRDVKQRTREHYEVLLERHLIGPFGALPLTSITVDDVRGWYATFATDTPTLRSHAYGLLRTILGTALSDGKISANPCAIRGAGSTKRVKQIRPATLPEIEKITTEMAERYKAMILLAAWCALRFGELTELRRKDIVLTTTVDAEGETVHTGIIRVEHGVVRVKGGYLVDTPKSDAGTRDVAIPPHLVPVLRDHLAVHVDGGPNALLFPSVSGGHLAPATFYRHYYKARSAADRADLRFHDLRHTGAVLAAATGATLAELMARLGHSTPQAAMRYQHAAQGRDQAIAAALSKIALGSN
ncbi:site-specific integrase [Mycolicibacterium austroafricanum]|uniref:Tyrosine-type recombinase/integrase n=1 Tax=Mycolicibacterium austroafricanum TaxID=39687 RepID=A0ABT8H949_MYCAO|nr:tyrosine-type recombinase/integrase [Mycolicibacterium austroafricanum]MDN4517290.1 tyrosine-type recombinase/integrase [Mycolicibacterium austroafricanum]QRZ09090.1 tyrosine-type recombinase/integrase family protein [Mycolicibacterium austroafricanum]QZT70865.1 site-specific integrase [Mycolicibacterium austroafricanum]